MLTELMGYRTQSFNSETTTRNAWLISNRLSYPNVVLLAQHVLAIPPTQIDNERVFSLAGKIAYPSRRSISTDNIDNFVSIARNYLNVASIDSKWIASVASLEELSDYLLKEEITFETSISINLYV